MSPWVTPATGNVVPAANERILYALAKAMRAGSGYSATVTTFNAATAYAEGSAFLCDHPTADDDGTPSVRIVGMYNVTALGAATSITARVFANVRTATANSGVVGTGVELYAAAAVTTTGVKFIDSGIVSLASLVTAVNGYGVMQLMPTYRFDENSGAGADPTITTPSILLLPSIV